MSKEFSTSLSLGGVLSRRWWVILHFSDSSSLNGVGAIHTGMGTICPLIVILCLAAFFCLINICKIPPHKRVSFKKRTTNIFFQFAILVISKKFPIKIS